MANPLIGDLLANTAFDILAGEETINRLGGFSTDRLITCCCFGVN